MDRDLARQAAEALLDRAPGAAERNKQRLDCRLAELVGVLQDLVPGGDLWRLMRRQLGDQDPEGVGSLLEWSLMVLDEEALHRVMLVEANDEHRGLQVPVLRIPFDLITVVSVTDSRTCDQGAHRLQRIWRFRVGRALVPWSRPEHNRLLLEEDRILGTALDSDDRFIHELARRSGWPVNPDLVES